MDLTFKKGRPVDNKRTGLWFWSVGFWETET